MNSATSDINQRTSRQAMQLPESFVRSVLFGYEKFLTTLVNCTDENLLKILGQSADLKERYAAGVVLACRGDARFLTPPLVFIPGTVARIGLFAEEVSLVAKSLAHLGVLESWIQKEVPAHEVPLKDFKIGKYPVTNGEYLDFLLETEWPELPSSWSFGQYPADKSNHPVFTITPEAADEYCRWLSKKTGRNFRLPTEAEWEFAAAGPKALEYPWGSEFRLGICNTLEAKIYSSTPVGMFPESDSLFGVSDMAGNVEEFVREDYAPYPGGEYIEDDLLLQFGKYRVARGGSFTRHYDLARCKRRHGFYQKDIYVMGFRIVEEI